MKIYIIILKKNLTHPYRLQIKIKDNLRKNSIPMSIKLKFIFSIYNNFFFLDLFHLFQYLCFLPFIMKYFNYIYSLKASK